MTSVLKVDNIQNSSGTDAISIDSSGKVGIGETSPVDRLHLHSSSAETNGIRMSNSATGSTSSDGFQIYAGYTGEAVIRQRENNDMVFMTNSTERMRIDNATTTITQGVNNNYALQVDQDTSGANAYGVAIRYTSSNNDNHNGEFIHCEDTSATRFMVKNDGDVQNHDNAYGGISDQKLKEQIADASSQWDDIKALQIRKYKMKEDVANADADSDALFKLGVIAQELETAGMSGLVSSSPDFDSDGNDLGTVTKGVKYSILYMKAVKALQEAITKIETLETEMTSLKARVQALEDA